MALRINLRRESRTGGCYVWRGKRKRRKEKRRRNEKEEEKGAISSRLFSAPFFTSPRIPEQETARTFCAFEPFIIEAVWVVSTFNGARGEEGRRREKKKRVLSAEYSREKKIYFCCPETTENRYDSRVLYLINQFFRFFFFRKVFYNNDLGKKGAVKGSVTTLTTSSTPRNSCFVARKRSSIVYNRKIGVKSARGTGGGREGGRERGMG